MTRKVEFIRDCETHHIYEKESKRCLGNFYFIITLKSCNRVLRYNIFLLIHIWCLKDKTNRISYDIRNVRGNVEQEDSLKAPLDSVNLLVVQVTNA